MRRILTCGVVLSLAALAGVWLLTRHDPNRIPADWDLTRIGKEHWGDGRLRILAWTETARLDPPGIRGGSFLAVRESSDGDVYIAYLAGEGFQWEMQALGIWSPDSQAFNSNARHTGIRLCRKPTNRDIYELLDSVRAFDNDSDRPIVDAAVCEKDWIDVTGEAPTRFYRFNPAQRWTIWLRSKWRTAFGGAAPK